MCYHGVDADLCRVCRYLPEHEAAAIRRGLRSYDGVRFAAFNRDEVDAIIALLTPQERARVSFSWLTWGGR